jgi:transcriptional regulator with XRE-family HTH domain
MPKFDDHEKICRRVADLLSAEREKQKMSMTLLAADAGLAQSAMSYFENHKRAPNLKTLLRIADVLRVDLGKLIQRAIKDVRG